MNVVLNKKDNVVYCMYMSNVYEDLYSCDYDREYSLIKLTDLRKDEFVDMRTFERYITNIRIRSKEQFEAFNKQYINLTIDSLIIMLQGNKPYLKTYIDISYFDSYFTLLANKFVLDIKDKELKTIELKDITHIELTSIKNKEEKEELEIDLNKGQERFLSVSNLKEISKIKPVFRW